MTRFIQRLLGRRTETFYLALGSLKFVSSSCESHTVYPFIGRPLCVVVAEAHGDDDNHRYGIHLSE